MRKDIITRIKTDMIINIHHIVGVQAFAQWSFANSVAFPIRPSSRICFHSFILRRMVIQYGMIANVMIKDAIRDASMKKRLYTGKGLIVKKLVYVNNRSIEKTDKKAK